MLPGRVGPCGGQAPHRLPSEFGKCRAGGSPPFRFGSGRARCDGASGLWRSGRNLVCAKAPGCSGDPRDITGPRCKDAVASVRSYIALAAANRVVAPCSKLAFSDWRDTTAGPRILKTPKGSLEHRRFWEAMDVLGADDPVKAEQAIVAKAAGEFDLDLPELIVDITNFTRLRACIFLARSHHLNDVGQ